MALSSSSNAAPVPSSGVHTLGLAMQDNWTIEILRLRGNEIGSRLAGGFSFAADPSRPQSIDNFT
jgi:hypothetical protein